MYDLMPSRWERDFSFGGIFLSHIMEMAYTHLTFAVYIYTLSIFLDSPQQVAVLIRLCVDSLSL